MPHHEGTKNEEYDLVSVLYHALEGAQTNEIYSRDAEQAGDTNLAQFFREVQQEDIKRAEKAKQILGQRMAKGTK